MLSLIIALSVCLCLGTSAMAVNGNDTLESVDQTFYVVGAYEPLGSLTEEECEALLASSMDWCNECPTTRHFALATHTHSVTNITGTTTRLTTAKQVNRTRDRLPTDAVLDFSVAMTVGNSWSATIGFEKKVVSASVGYDVEASGTRTAGYSIKVPAGELALITLSEEYKVTYFDCMTTWYPDPISGTRYDEMGTGSSEQWVSFVYGADYW